MGGFLSGLTPVKNSEVLNATCGPVRGNIYEYKGVTVDGYLGIPFAKPPIGELRFKKPVAADIWTEPRDCYNYGPMCVQTGAFVGAPEKVPPPEEAGCLNLNVWTPRKPSEEFPNGRPVIVFIPGGAFQMSGSGDFCNYSMAGTLPLKDVVVVTLNYRLGAFGFFTTGDEVCRGNLGLWDQTLALQWVQNHISSFGGDPTMVTLMGQSAGGASTDLLSLSPYSRDLFQRFIPISGSAFAGFAMRTAENQAKVSLEFAKFNGFQGGDSEDLLKWYQAQSAEKLSNIKLFQKPVSGSVTFGPNFDGDFFPKPLDELRAEATKKQMIVGSADYEALILVGANVAYAPAINGIRMAAKETYGSDVVSNPEETQKKFISYYTNGVNILDEATMRKKMIEAIGDETFNSGALLSAISAAEHGNEVYFYTFEYANPNGFGLFNNLLPFKAATHCTELRYLLGEGVYSNFEPNQEDFEMIDTMTTLFSNFAKYGTPNGKGPIVWEKFNKDTPERHYRIAYPEGSMSDVYHEGRCEFVNTIDTNSFKYEELIFGKKTSG